MSDYIGTRKQVDEYVGSRLVEAAYLGSRKYYDAYSEVSGTLPLTYNSRTEHILKNYALYGSASGAGVETENLWDEKTKNGYYNQTTGEFIRTGNWKCCKSLVPVDANKKHYLTFDKTYSTGSVTIGMCYDSNGVFIGKAQMTVERYYYRYSFTTLPETAFTSFYFSTSFDKCALWTAPNGYTPYGYQIPLTNTGENSQSETYPLYIGSTKLGEEEYVDYESGKVYKRTENLFDVDAKDPEKGYVNGYRLRENGNLSSGSSLAVSEFIKIEPNTDYYLRWIYAGVTLAYCLYDSDKQYLSGRAYSFYGESATGGIVTTGNASYIRFTINKSVADSIMLIEGSTAPVAYIPYYRPTDPPVPLPAITAYKGENTLSSTETVGTVTVKGRISTPST